MTETKWLTIAEASLLASSKGLDRTHKTIRSWCRKGDVIAEKQTIQNGDMWVLDKDSLETKINFEIEVRDQKEKARTMSEPVQTGSDQFEPVRTSADQFDHMKSRAADDGGYGQGFQAGVNQREPHADLSAQLKIRELDDKIIALRIDLGWREKLMSKLREENERGQDTLHAQARYIGHLESDLMRLGGKPDQTFLAAPKPQDRQVPESTIQPEIIQEQRPHPDQSSFYQNRSG